MNLSANFIGDSNDEINFSHKLLLTDIQVSRICKSFASGSSANTKCSKTKLSKMVQLGGFITDEMLRQFSSFKIFDSKYNTINEIDEAIKKILINILAHAGVNILLKQDFQNLVV